MSGRDSDPSAGPADPEPVLQRWSRLKAQARAAEQIQAQAAPDAPPVAPPATSEAAPSAEPPRLELPDLELLGQDSDYSAFLAPGVDLSLRRRALRKLFASPKFNVFDGLDTYRDDFTSFPALGDIVTVDMQHQVERLARKALENLETDAGDEAPRAITAPTPADPTMTPTTTQTSFSNTNLPATTSHTNLTSASTPTQATVATAPPTPAPAPAPAITADTTPEHRAAPTEKD